jgi:hypothetical protein
MYIDHRAKYPFLLSDFNKAWKFSTDIRQIFNHISWKSFQWEPRFSMRLEGLTKRQPNMTKLIVAFRSSTNAPKDLLFPYKTGTFLNIGTTVMMMIQVFWHVTVSTGTVASQYWLWPTEQLSGIAPVAIQEALYPTEDFFWGGGKGWWGVPSEQLLGLYSLKRLCLLPEDVWKLLALGWKF